MARITTARRVRIVAESVQQALQMLAALRGVMTAGQISIVIRPRKTQR